MKEQTKKEPKQRLTSELHRQRQLMRRLKLTPVDSDFLHSLPPQGHTHMPEKLYIKNFKIGLLKNQ